MTSGVRLPARSAIELELIGVSLLAALLGSGDRLEQAPLLRSEQQPGELFPGEDLEPEP